MNYTKGNMVAVRNIALSYTFPEKWLGKLVPIVVRSMVKY